MRKVLAQATEPVAKEEKKITGAEIFVRALEAEGVKVIFGYPGGAVLPLYDALYQTGKITHILMRHEQGAAHAADGYARASGRPGVCLATSGPGATNLVTGLANAYMDSIPIVAFTGQVARGLLGRDSFQEADITGITYPITKHNYLVRDVNDLARIIHEAFYIATTGRPGPVLVDLPKDVATQTASFSYAPKLQLPGYRITSQPNSRQVAQAVKAIAGAERPVILAGGGVIQAGACEELKEFAERIQAPVATTLMGKGAFPEDHSLSLGMAGMHGTVYANYALSNCSLLIALGVRFADRVTGDVKSFAPYAKIIHVDIDPAEIGKNIIPHIPIVGDVRQTLKEFLKHLAPQVSSPEWREQINRWREEFPLRYRQDPAGEIKPQYVLEEIHRVTQGEAIVVTEVGQHQMWAAQYYRCKKPRTFISSGGLGTMGFGLPAAIGVQIACPETLVFDVAGDGSFQMSSQQLAVAVNYKLPLKIAIINNGYLGMVRQWQEFFHGKRYSQTSLAGSPDFVKLAEAYGAKGIRINRPQDVRPALEEAICSPEVYVLDFIVSPEENVYPMVPPGAPINQFLGI